MCDRVCCLEIAVWFSISVQLIFSGLGESIFLFVCFGFHYNLFVCMAGGVWDRVFACLFVWDFLQVGQSRSKTETFDSSACGFQLSSTAPKLGEINIKQSITIFLNDTSFQCLEDANLKYLKLKWVDAKDAIASNKVSVFLCEL